MIALLRKEPILRVAPLYCHLWTIYMKGVRRVRYGNLAMLSKPAHIETYLRFRTLDLMHGIHRRHYLLVIWSAVLLLRLAAVASRYQVHFVHVLWRPDQFVTCRLEH